MTIKKESKFETSDGQLWDDQTRAKEHENELHAYGELSRLLQPSIVTNRVESVIRHILAEEDMVRAILVSYHKRQPKAVVHTELAKAA